MKIIEILVGDQETPIDDTFLPPHRIPDQDLMAHIANAFTRDRVTKLLWDLQMAGQPVQPEPAQGESRIHRGTTDEVSRSPSDPCHEKPGRIASI